MRLGRLGLAAIATVLMGCATAEPIEDDGAGGTPAGGNSGTGGKADNPNGGGSGGSSAGGAAGQAGSGGTSSGGTSSGGTSSGGTSSGGASSGGTSSGGTSSGGGGGSCSTGQKKCGGVCIAPSPGVGCALQDDQCTTCPNPPANGTSECQGTLCSFKCNPGYTKSGTNSCVSTGGGGAPGGGGGGGSGGSTGCAAPCDASKIQDQLICNFYCAPITGKLGLCAPVLNCCTCPA
ncbi:MAG: hypothetical protein L6Q84_23980 [Polyangiaceae bacterium]|nr:hypothetical protein [Polyangiaceae bacterium]